MVGGCFQGFLVAQTVEASFPTGLVVVGQRDLHEPFPYPIVLVSLFFGTFRKQSATPGRGVESNGLAIIGFLTFVSAVVQRHFFLRAFPLADAGFPFASFPLFFVEGDPSLVK